ncbi:MAG: metallophosphoesterase family protein [Actinomycetota bacterium]|nr:metallophosphoesterase family protein [Actinomycetota bacterium]
MRIAILGDIHGNLPALEAVVADLERQSVDQVWCSGDIGWGAPWPSECIAIVRESGWTTVKGNTDVWITGDPQTVTDPEQREELGDLASAHAISPEDAQWLINLPIGHAGPGSILLVHATPESPFTAPQADDAAAEFQIYEGEASLVLYGHIHMAFVRRLSEGTLVANPGSVGLPRDGSTASYLIVDRGGTDILLRHRRVAFDIEEAITRAEQVGGKLAAPFIEAMRSLT